MIHQFNQQTQVVCEKPLYDPVYANEAFSSQHIEYLIRHVSTLEQQPAQVGGHSQGVIDSSIRRSAVSWIIPAQTPELAKHVENLFLSINDQHYQFSLDGTESYQFTVYDAQYSGGYSWHQDTARIGGFVRKLSASILLSDPSEYVGGNLILAPHGLPLVAEEKKGRAVFFPSWVPHCVTPVTRGVRKSLVIWAHGPMFK